MGVEQLEKADPHYSGRPDDDDAPSIADLHDARVRWGTMAMSAILESEQEGGIGLRKFLEFADTTQRELVGSVAKDFYADELGLTEDTLATFLDVTVAGITGCGFEHEALAEDTETRAVIEARSCPIVDHANLAGYENGDPAMDNLSLWCDTYDNFESAAVSPSQGLIHSHCIGKGDKYCRIICQTIKPEDKRKEGEHIFDYTARLRASEQKFKPDGPWVLDNKSPELVEELIRDFVSNSWELQSKIAPTYYDRKAMGAEIWGRIGAVSTLMAGKLMGWAKFIESTTNGKQSRALRKAAKAKADSKGITGNTASDAADLHLALIKGQGFGDYTITKDGSDCVKGACDFCPMIEWGREAELDGELSNLSNWCTAARTQEAQTISPDLTHTYTHCIGKGDESCHWTIAKA